MNNNRFFSSPRFWYVLIGLAFILTRVFAWHNTTILEDHDSVSYLNDMKTILSLNWDAIKNLSPDSTPVYPMLGALFNIPGWPTEVGARLASLFASTLLFIFIILLGRKIANPIEIGFALLLLALHPFYIPFSNSILTEPAYVSVVYAGFLLFFIQYKKPAPLKGLLLGIIFGICFLTRTEGILFLAAIPFFQVIHFVFDKTKEYNFRKFLIWGCLFVIGFGLISLPQVWRVSQKMGRLAINGRQVWELILNNPDGKVYEHKIYGLDYSPSEINLQYIQSHAEKIQAFESSMKIREFVKLFIKNFDDLYQNQLGVLIGPLGLIFCGFGVLALFRHGRFFDLFYVLAFVGAGLFAPLIHDVEMRHIAVIGPILFLLTGIGITYASKLAFESIQIKRKTIFNSKNLSLTFVAVLLVCVANPVWQGMHPPDFNYDYNINDLKEPLAVIHSGKNHNDGSLSIVARKAFLAYYANATAYFLPYTDYAGLVRYCDLNDVDYVYLQHNLVYKFPFADRFKNIDTPDFELVYSNNKIQGLIQLFKFKENSEFKRNLISKE